MEEKKETGSFIENVGRGLLSGLEYATVKTDDLMNFLTGTVLMPVEYLDKEMQGEVIKYLDEQSEYRNKLVEEIKSNRENLDKYVKENPIKGAFLKPVYSAMEQFGDVTMLPINALTLGKGGAIANGLFNGVEYTYEQSIIYNKNLKDYQIDDAIGLTTSIALGGLTNKLTHGNDIKALYDDNIKYDKIWSIKTGEERAPLDKVIDLKNNIGNNLDLKIHGEIVERIESGQTQSIPKGFNNSKRVSETIEKGTLKRINEISNSWKATHFANQQHGDVKVKINADTTRDVATKGAISEVMKPIYTEIELGQKQALGEIADTLVAWNQKNKNYDGITPIADIIDETIEGIKKEEFIKIFQGKTTNEKYQDLSLELSKLLKEAIKIKSKKEFLNDDEGFYFDTMYDKERFLFDLYRLAKDELLDMEEKTNYIKSQLKNIGDNVYLDNITAKKYGYNSGGNFFLEDNPELLGELFKDISSTTDKYNKAIKNGKIQGNTKSLLDVAIKWGNLKEKEKYNKIINSNQASLSSEDMDFKSNFERQALEKIESIFQGYEKGSREIMEDVISTVVDERSGYNVFKSKFKKYFSDINDIEEIKAEGEVEIAIKDNIKNIANSLNSLNKLKAKKYDDLTLADKTVGFMKNTSAYKLLFGIRHLRESSPNTGIVNSGANKLGFNNQYSFIKSFYDMGKIHYDIATNLDKRIKRDLSTIADPYERMENEIFLRRNLENNYAFDKKSFANLLQKGAKVSGVGQLVSDIHRIVMATRMTTKAMKDEFLKLSFDEMTPTMKSILKSNGITDDIELSKLKIEIKSFKNQMEFDDYIINVDIQKGGKLKSIFEQFVDVMGREFEPFEKDLTVLEGKNFISQLWLNSVMMFKRYSMGAFSRAWKNATTYYDDNDILRYKFLKNNKFQWDSFSKVNWRNSIQGFGRRNTTNFLKMSAMLWASTEVTTWLHGKIFGTSQDEVVEAKLEALKTDTIPIVMEGLFDSATNYIGYDVMFGGTPAIIGITTDTYKGIKRTVTAENLETHEKIIYGLLRTISPSNIARGIDNLKLEKPISPRLITFSKDAQFLWKNYYKKDAELEQVEGEFPIEKVFGVITNWYEYFKNNPEKAKEIVDLGEKRDEESVIMLASGIVETAEQGMRAEHINYAFSIEEIEERERTLKEFKLDYKSQLGKLDNKIRTNFNLLMAFKGVQDPLYLMQALESVVVAKNKYKALENLLEEHEINNFNNFMIRAKKLKKERNEIASRGYEDNTEGYIEFLNELKKVIDY